MVSAPVQDLVEVLEHHLDVVLGHSTAGQLTPERAAQVGHGVSRDPGGPVRTAFIRAPWIEEAGADVEVLARIPATDTAGREVAAAGKIVAARQGPLLATAFHPEITGDARVHGLFARIIEDSRRS
jgi:glutamine amidotransferase PdxT